MHRSLLFPVACLFAVSLNAQPAPSGRADALRAELTALNQRIESRAANAVDVLAGVTDSPDSRLIVSHVKGDAIKGLKANLQVVRSKREMMRDQALRYGGPAAAELQAEVARLDVRIGNRIDQIIRLVQSLDESEEISRYRLELRDEDIRMRQDERWRQNQVSTTFSKGERKTVITELESAIRSLEAEAKKIAAFAARPGSASQQARFAQDAARIEGLLVQRRAQLEHAMRGPGPRRKLDRTDANELRKLFADLTKDLRSDTTSLNRKYSDYVNAVTAAAR
jgi:hypothetical protein